MYTTDTEFDVNEVQKLIYDLGVEENRFEVELRQLSRNKTVLPVEVWTEKGERLEAVTRNLAERGACLVMPRPFGKGEFARIKITGRNYQSEQIDVRCQWNQNFCKRYWVSGWQFGQAINPESLAEEATILGTQRRHSPRFRLAVPVVARPKQTKRIFHCFSRDISAQGICLIGKSKIGYGCRAELGLTRKCGTNIAINATSVWTTPLGRTYWMSGWKFDLPSES